MDQQEVHECLAGDGPPGLRRPEVGGLLVAMPMLGDPNFDRTVVMLVGQLDGGYQGVIISEPSTQNVRTLLPQWWQKAAPPRKLHRGGPVEPQLLMCLAVGRRGLQRDGLVRVRDYSTQTLYRVEGDIEPEDLSSGITGVRLFSGYSGWAHDQLLEEIAVGAWVCVPSEPSDAVTPHSATLWREVLTRQGGASAFLRTCPENPLRN